MFDSNSFRFRNFQTDFVDDAISSLGQLDPPFAFVVKREVEKAWTEEFKKALTGLGRVQSLHFF